ncbi:MAG: MOSC domain-containing protein [Campylobacteraceae bacterium]|jgi:MOSC domain-containing protein YiiM|nr:MOSC domain-containing protein [Campylobacteraceae bacterium]MBT3883109.1 MOSC domain-containing protein [Campylobacteraceae bacterium]MBT4179869.1 MOSC domain-containing protein [Campylobacteraceae bacterium]MBT4572582.1 MOSC domain-containing protein [Campylobacteraceae bacterium]MBT4707372.1 MOSC domain-containing protein [Campylobacteraceae bacterium]
MKNKNIISKVISTQISIVKKIDDGEKVWETGSFKDKTNDILEVKFDGIIGNEVSDLKHHGGIDKAIFANALDNYPKWAQYLGKDNLEYGALAENLTLSNLNEDNVCIGDIHKIGTVILEVSQPREPCWKIGQKFKHKEFTKYIYDTGETGWYYRVIEEGNFQVNNDVQLVKKASESFTIREANYILRNPFENKEETNKLINIEVLGKPFRNSLNRKL